MKSENKNFILNAIYQLLTYVFPLITVSYVSQNLGVDNVGIYSYTYSIVYMFMLVGMLGINNYGNRSIARVRDDREQLSKTFFTIYGLQVLITLFTIIAYIFYLIFFCNKYIDIATIQVIQLISVLFDVNWFFFGLEKFKLTITRNFLIKIGSMVLIFIFVKSSGDLWKYTLIMSISVLLSQLYLILNLHKYVTYSNYSLLESLSHFKSVLILFIPVLAFGVYRVMDKTMIGALSSVTELGYYENAERLINIPISLINALGTVMLPRMAYLLNNKKIDYRKPLYESMKLALIMSVIMAGGLTLISDDISIVLFGKEFLKSGNIIKILSITVIVSAWSNVIRTQYLIPKSMDKIYINSTIGGAIINLLLNIMLIKKYGSYGACVGTVAAECFVAFYQTIMIKNEIDTKKYLIELFINIIKMGCIISAAFILGHYFKNIYIRLSVNFITAVVGFLLLYHKYIVYDFLGFKKID